MNQPRLTIPITLVLIGIALTCMLDKIEAQTGHTATIEGRVLDNDTGEPLRGVHVFLSGTRMGAVTNDAGRYQLSRVPAGAHRLVFSSIGYGRTSEEIRVSEGEIISRDERLEPVIYGLSDLYVGNLDDRWERYLRQFFELFIGYSSFADSVEILNPEVLRFESRWWGRLRATALAPLVIENRALGYRITYFLDEFHHSGSTTRWDGDPLFEELSPRDSSEATQWRLNRRIAFYGSLRHFFLSLTSDRLEEEGFTVHRIPRQAAPDGRSREIPTSADRLVSPEEDDPFYTFNFYGRLQVEFARAAEEPRFLQWSGQTNRHTRPQQTSYLTLNENPVTLGPDGEMLETYGATQYGYFSFLRMANQIPREYRPDDISDELRFEEVPEER